MGFWQRLSFAVVSFVLAFPFFQSVGFAAPLLAWDSGNHVWVQISPDNVNLQVGTSPGSNGGNLIPDVLNVACPPASTTVLSTTNSACFVAPNDGHTYQLIGYQTRSTNACLSSGATYSVEVAPAMTPAGSGSSQVVAACATAVVANQPITGATMTPSTGAGTPTPTPVLLQAGGQVDAVYANATAVTGLTGTATLKRVS